MKTWLFAVVQSTIGLLGLAAYFLADNLILAAAAASLAAAVAIVQPLLSAHKARRMEEYRDRQHEQSVTAVDEQVQELLADSIAPPLPHRATVVELLKVRFRDRADALLNEYDAVTRRLASAESAAAVSEFAGKVTEIALGDYLLGLNALAAEQFDTAHICFRSAIRRQPQWVAPWLGWATTCWKRAAWDELRAEHPHLNGVELLPYGAGDQETFLALDEEQRQELSDLFQSVANSLGNYYAAAECSSSRARIEQAHQDLKQAA